jgi:methyl-accepting chemotaxis protein
MSNPVTPTQVADHRLLSESLALLAPVADQVIGAFYDQLFADQPQYRAMFPADMDGQRDRLLKAVVALVTHYEDPDALVPALATMGRAHARFPIGLAEYAAVGQALLITLARFAGPAWTPQYERAWTRAYTFAAGTMLQASATADPTLTSAA